MSLVLTEQSHARDGVSLVRAKGELRSALVAARRAGRAIGLVPTMGSLHEGHLSLLRAARAECDLVVMSLFVNPAQFGPGEDLERYPRDEQRDAGLAAEAGVDLVYAPPVAQVYPDGFSTAVEAGDLTEVLCGDPSHRGPGHFRGVATVVAKLLNSVQPDVAYFGQKDAQQLAVIRRIVRDPSHRGPGHFRGVATVVAKLLNSVQPDVAYFGQKDAQQLAVIRRIVRD